MVADRAAAVEILDGLEGAHEAETPVGRDDGHEMQHKRGEDWVHSVFDEEGDFRDIVGGFDGCAVFQGDAREFGDAWYCGLEEEECEDTVQVVQISLRYQYHGKHGVTSQPSSGIPMVWMNLEAN